MHTLGIIGHGIDMVLESRFERRREKWSETILSPTEKEIYDGLLFTRKLMENKFFIPNNIKFPLSRKIFENKFFEIN